MQPSRSLTQTLTSSMWSNNSASCSNGWRSVMRVIPALEAAVSLWILSWDGAVREIAAIALVAGQGIRWPSIPARREGATTPTAEGSGMKRYGAALVLFWLAAALPARADAVLTV